MLKEAKIIFPLKDNDGNSLDTLNDDLITEIIHEFGGISVSNSLGYWLDCNGDLFKDYVNELVFACDDNATVDEKINNLAIKYGQLAKQLAIYVKYPSQDVDIIDLTGLTVTNILTKGAENGQRI